MSVIDINEIKQYLPHRYPFLLVDRIIELELDKRVVGIKNVTINEPFFPGHFPTNPVMPGVLIVEAMAQTAAVLAFKQQLATVAADVAGVIRVTCPEPIVFRITQSDLLQRFASRHPALQVHFVTSDRYVDLAKGEADVALRSGDTDDGDLVGRKIGDSIWAVYASRAYIERHGQPAPARLDAVIDDGLRRELQVGIEERQQARIEPLVAPNDGFINGLQDVEVVRGSLYVGATGGIFLQTSGGYLRVAGNGSPGVDGDGRPRHASASWALHIDTTMTGRTGAKKPTRESELHAARAGAVLHDHRLAQALGQARRHGARQQVGGAAGWVRHDELDRLVDAGLGHRMAWRQRRCGQGLQRNAAGV